MRPATASPQSSPHQVTPWNPSRPSRAHSQQVHLAGIVAKYLDFLLGPSEFLGREILAAHLDPTGAVEWSSVTVGTGLQGSLQVPQQEAFSPEQMVRVLEVSVVTAGTLSSAEISTFCC